MARRRSIGVALWGWYFILVSLTGFLVNVHLLMKEAAPDSGFFKLSFRLLLILCVLNFFIGLNLLRLKELWRKIALGYTVFVIFCCLVSIPFFEILSGEEYAVLAFAVLICISLLFFFTRRGVKEQFRQPCKPCKTH